jgi:uncharacterized protein DUF4197
MTRPRILTSLALSGVLGMTAPGIVLADAAALQALSSHDAAGGLKAALSKGIGTAVSQLGAKNGFLNDPKVAIPLPANLDKADRALRMIGMGKDADELKATMNHAAEDAVSQAKPIFEQALHHMSVSDAKGILTGGEGSATAYFRKATSGQLTAKFKPVVAAETAKLGLAKKYDEYAGKASQFGLVSAKDANLDDYVTGKALDGLFSRIADEEHEIRAHPMEQASGLIKKVFGAL